MKHRWTRLLFEALLGIPALILLSKFMGGETLLAIEPITTAALITAGSSLLSGSKGGGGKKGSSQASLELPDSFKRVAGPMSKLMHGILTGQGGPKVRRAMGTPFGQGLQNAVNFFSNFSDSPDSNLALDVFRQAAEDPTKLTDPLFNQEFKRFSGELDELDRQRGGLLTTSDRKPRQLSDFINRYLSGARDFQIAGAQGLTNTRQQIGEAQFTPFRFFSSALPGLGGNPTAIPPPQYNNSKGQLGNTLGQFGGAYANSKRPTTATGDLQGYPSIPSPGGGQYR